MVFRHEPQLPILGSLTRTSLYKVGRVFPMVIWSEFRLGKNRDDDHRKDAPYFSIQKYLQAKFLVSSPSCAAIISAFLTGSVSSKIDLWNSSSYLTKSPNNTINSTWKKTMVAQNCHEFCWNLNNWLKITNFGPKWPKFDHFSIKNDPN